MNCIPNTVSVDLWMCHPGFERDFYLECEESVGVERL